jgi:hypothetical protein
MLRRTNLIAERILAAAGGVLAAVETIRRHAERCPRCPTCAGRR